jgi:bla regulator protein BlaR1
LLARFVADHVHTLVSVRLNRQLANQHSLVEPRRARSAGECQRAMKRAPRPARRAKRSRARPALMGFIRPWLLLPEGMLEKFTPEELRFVFLHELAHLKRRDIAVNWLMTFLLILHWFNPLVWFAFARMRADRELACDALALSYANEREAKPYGQTILKLLDCFTRPAAVAGLVGILERPQQMKRRIAMIAQFKNRRECRWPQSH